MGTFPMIVVEGLDGSGKTSLRKALFRLFAGVYSVTPLCLLTTNWLDPTTASDLVEGKYRPTADNRDRYLAALRADKDACVQTLIRPNLAHRPVIADRWILSELAFFAAQHDTPAQQTYAALESAISVAADITFLLDLDVDTAMARAAARAGDAVRANWDTTQLQTRARQTYQEAYRDQAAFPKLGPIVRIHTTQALPEVIHTAWQALLQHRLLPDLRDGPRQDPGPGALRPAT